MSKIGVLGSGQVGEVLANGFLKHGHEVMRGSREPGKLEAWRKGAGPKASTGTFAETARYAEIVVLAVKGSAAANVLEACGDGVDGKPVIDATNPIDEAPPKDGVISFFTGPNESLMERLQAATPAAKLVKAFSCVGNAHMIDPDFGGQKPTMFICGNDKGAKEAVSTLLEQLGWEPEDMGAVTAARGIEPLCMLWCTRGFVQGKWGHAFKLLKK